MKKEININPEWVEYIEKGAKFPAWLEKILDFNNRLLVGLFRENLK